jgi:hypothetical protein
VRWPYNAGHLTARQLGVLAHSSEAMTVPPDGTTAKVL